MRASDPGPGGRMRDAMLRDERFAHLEKKVGLLFLAALAALAAAVVFLGVEQDVFSKKYTLHFMVDRATGFSEGMPVKLSGFRIGRVKRLELAEDARVRVTLQIQQKYRKWIRDSSWARLTKEGVIGESVVEVMVGRPGDPELADGDALFFAPTPSIDEMLEELKEEVAPVLYQVRDLVAWIADPEGDVRRTVGHLEAFSSGLPGTRRRVDDLLDDLRSDLQSIRERAVALLASVQDRADEAAPPLRDAARLVETLDRELPGLIERLDRLLANLESVSGEIRDLLEDSSGKIGAAVDTADEILQNGRDISESVKRIWPIRPNLPPEAPTLVPPDGFEGAGR